MISLSRIHYYGKFHGCSLLVLMSGRRLWPHELNDRCIRTVVSEAAFDGIAGRTLEHILARSISRVPQKRWSNGHALAAELECWLRCMAPQAASSSWRGGAALYQTPA